MSLTGTRHEELWKPGTQEAASRHALRRRFHGDVGTLAQTRNRARLSLNLSMAWPQKHGAFLYTGLVILKIVQAGDPVLRQTAQPLTPDEIRSTFCRHLIELMRQTMRDAPGVGLAAPQIGLALQLAVIEDREDLLKSMDPEALAERDRRPVPFTVIVNPVMTIEGSTVEFFEGCLSMTGFSAIVPRYRRVRVEYLDHNAEPVVIAAAGWHARILQHEIDHLHGTLYIDRMLPRSLTTADNLGRYWRDKPIVEVRRLLGC